MRLVCIRHLPTEWNERGLLQGQRDTDLLEPDEAALAAIAENTARLAEFGEFDLVLASALRRARRTAELHGYGGHTVEPLLNELSFGDYEGVPRDQFEEEFGERWSEDPRELVLGESLQELTERIRTFLRRYARHSQVLVFGHGSWMRALRSIVEHGDVRAMNRRWVANNEILVFEFDLNGEPATSPYSSPGPGGGEGGELIIERDLHKEEFLPG